MLLNDEDVNIAGVAVAGIFAGQCPYVDNLFGTFFAIFICHQLFLDLNSSVTSINSLQN
jgi:hypothetical protein